MKKGMIVFGIIILFIGLAISPSIYANRGKVSLEKVLNNDGFDIDGLTPIQLILLLIYKLNNYEGIENVESKDDILQIIESEAELNGIVENLMNYSCGCESESSDLKWSFPLICSFLSPFVVISLVVLVKLHRDLPYNILMTIGSILNCFWF